jgi:hypothetical protein
LNPVRLEHVSGLVMWRRAATEAAAQHPNLRERS